MKLGFLVLSLRLVVHALQSSPSPEPVQFSTEGAYARGQRALLWEPPSEHQLKERIDKARKVAEVLRREEVEDSIGPQELGQRTQLCRRHDFANDTSRSGCSRDDGSAVEACFALTPASRKGIRHVVMLSAPRHGEEPLREEDLKCAISC